MVQCGARAFACPTKKRFVARTTGGVLTNCVASVTTWREGLAAAQAREGRVADASRILGNVASGPGELGTAWSLSRKSLAIGRGLGDRD